MPSTRASESERHTQESMDRETPDMPEVLGQEGLDPGPQMD